MKTENKRFIALLCTVLILVGLVGCGVKPEGVQYTDFWANFEQILAPIADDYEITKLEPVEFGKGQMSETWTLTDKLLSDTYHVCVGYNEDGRVGSLTVIGDRKEHRNFNFAILCLYAYKSMGFEVADADAFYDEFNLLTPDPEGSKDVEPNMRVLAISTNKYITFAIGYNDENAPE